MSITSIEMKIVAFEEETNSLIVSFKSNSSTESFDNLRTYAYQPTVFDVQTADDFIKEVAKTGVSIAETQDKEVAIKENSEMIAAIKQRVGTTQVFNVADLFVQPTEPEAPTV